MKKRYILIVAGIMAGCFGAVASAAVQENMLTEALEAPELSGNSCIGKIVTDYAQTFDIYYYDNNYKIISVPESGDYLIVPEEAEIPEGAEDSYKIIQAPLDQVYLAATSAMSLIDAIGCTDSITMTGTDISGWNIQAPVDALKEGRMLFAGRYSEPNYELLVGQGCELAIESTMILHSPEVEEMLEDIDIPVFMDRSSFEQTGLGRTEWIKVYGAMFDAEEQAFEKYEEQKSILDEMDHYESTGKTIAYFSINTDGYCVIRRPDDYITAMITDAGGIYAFGDMDELNNGSATANISIEELYSKAVDADILVYNSTITGSVEGKKALLDKSELFADFKAYQEGNLWQVDAGLYQSTDKVSQLIRDFRIIMTGGDEEELTFLTKIQ